jgi:hypothetical protein
MTLRKTLYICGDSFCASDASYGESWVDQLTQRLPHVQVVRLASIAASNYLIALQVKEALEAGCDYLIYNATSSTRFEYSLRHDGVPIDSTSRYWHVDDQVNKSVTSHSWHSATNGTMDLLIKKDNLIKEFFEQCVDFPSMIMKNYMLIDYTLKCIAEKMAPTTWAWSRGGFEHPRFSQSAHPNFNPCSLHWDFARYQHNHCAMNLWDNFDQLQRRPYFHVTDADIKRKTCDHYIAMLGLDQS